MLRLLLGNDPLFQVPQYQLVDPWEFGVYAVLGIVGGLVSAIFTKLLLRMRERFLRLPRKTLWVQPVTGGLLVGVMGWFVPQLLGVGYAHDLRRHDLRDHARLRGHRSLNDFESAKPLYFFAASAETHLRSVSGSGWNSLAERGGSPAAHPAPRSRYHACRDGRSAFTDDHTRSTRACALQSLQCVASDRRARRGRSHWSRRA